MVFKLIITGISSFSLGLVIGILIIYFLAGRTFFNFMKIDRMNMCSEMDSNAGEIHEDIYTRSVAAKKQQLLERKEEIIDGEEE